MSEDLKVCPFCGERATKAIGQSNLGGTTFEAASCKCVGFMRIPLHIWNSAWAHKRIEELENKLKAAIDNKDQWFESSVAYEQKCHELETRVAELEDMQSFYKAEKDNDRERVAALSEELSNAVRELQHLYNHYYALVDCHDECEGYSGIKPVIESATALLDSQK